MSAQTAFSGAGLPRSHYFLTLARGEAMRTVALRAGVVYVTAAVAAGFALLGLGAILCLLFHDELVASLMSRQARMQYAYEDRIEGLRGELQQQTLRQLRDQASLEGKIRDLVSRASRLEGRNDLLANLMPQAPVAPPAASPSPLRAVAGEGDARFRNPLRQPGDTPLLPPGLTGFAPLPAPTAPPASKPHPEPEIDNPPTAASKPPRPLSLLETGRMPLRTSLTTLDAAFDDVSQAQVGTLMRLGSAARAETAQLVAVLDDVGLSSDRFRSGKAAAGGTGGPFVPLPAASADAFGSAMAEVQDAVATTVRLRDALRHVPLASPVIGPAEVTSPFGARIDPFLGRPALHTGLDLREDYGALAKVTAAGKVVSAGPVGGYGNMVEVDHGDGLATRYAHLSTILVSPGQNLSRGDAVGEVGATGRATGPHLHYEVRIDGEPVDPMRFLRVHDRIGALALQ